MSLIIIGEKQVELPRDRRACDDITGVCVCVSGVDRRAIINDDSLVRGWNAAYRTCWH